jgi:hypothetical protein
VDRAVGDALCFLVSSLCSLLHDFLFMHNAIKRNLAHFSTAHSEKKNVCVMTANNKKLTLCKFSHYVPDNEAFVWIRKSRPKPIELTRSDNVSSHPTIFKIQSQLTLTSYNVSDKRFGHSKIHQRSNFYLNDDAVINDKSYNRDFCIDAKVVGEISK